jgi:hypothetical protein
MWHRMDTKSDCRDYAAWLGGGRSTVYDHLAWARSGPENEPLSGSRPISAHRRFSGARRSAGVAQVGGARSRSYRPGARWRSGPGARDARDLSRNQVVAHERVELGTNSSIRLVTTYTAHVYRQGPCQDRLRYPAGEHADSAGLPDRFERTRPCTTTSSSVVAAPAACWPRA